MSDEQTQSTTGEAHPSSAPTLGYSKGDSIGRYRLIRALGEGGFGVVWWAEQVEPVRREVALKLIKPGMDSKAVLARFEAERQALAVMDHVCIATVLDGGATDRGLPYFVMELVKGEPLTEFCDRHRLSVADRLGLFIRVCEAVQHAHMKGVVHRDLKPSNILVAYDADGKAQPKVIDFGIAKALSQRLTEATIFTERGQMIGTPSYMSPEQAEMSGLDIDTRSDVYSLGVVLYELLTGVLPFDTRTLRAAGYAEIQRIIREVDPPRPSTRLSSVGEDEEARSRIIEDRSCDLRELRTTLKQDLDWIVMRCLEKERSRRYDAASDIADELRRYLNHEPVAAGPPSALYRARKFVRRNRVGVVAGSLVAGALVVAVIGTTWGMMWAMAERDRASKAETAAEQRAEELELVSEFQSSQLSGVDAAAMGAGLRESLMRQVRDSMRRNGAGDEETTANLETLRALLGDANFTMLSLEALNVNVFARARAAIDSDFADQPLIRARLLQTLASTLRAVGLETEGLEPQLEAMNLRRAELGGLHPDTLYSIGRTGAMLAVLDRYADAEPYLREEYEGSKQVLGADHPLTLGSLNNLGVVIGVLGRNDEALAVLQDVLARERRVLGNADSKTINTISSIGDRLRDLDRIDEAEPYYREAFERSREAFGDDYYLTINKRGMLARALTRLDRLDEAEAVLLPGVDSARRVLGDGHWSTLELIDSLGHLYRARGMLPEAEVQIRTAWELGKKSVGPGAPATQWTLDSLVGVLIEQGKFAEAEALCLQPGNAPDNARSAERLVKLYEQWNEAEPGGGHDVQADAWRAKLTGARSGHDSGEP